MTGRVAFLTGASGGLGEHFARLLSRNGAAVAITARRVDKIEALAAELNAAGGRAIAFALDVADAHAIAPALDRAAAELGTIDILVNNAGVGGEGMALDLTIEEFDTTFNVNVRATYFAAREAAARMIAAKVEGRIINIASIASHTVLPGLSAYCGSKAAVAMLTKSLAREWARKGIAVNALCPGYIETGINDFWWPTEGGQKQLKGFPRRRLMDAEDLDAAFLMLAGPAARAITGSVFTVDDGQSLPGGG
ncbi:SDR family NAD(P)-dependent oxidoreductase [uncultured Phenylobacterium sp.]|uniref:SDR family NAD(P)-dependent oxidoreductase n=1 Tax=uncultured Phenylobacterium sp. TaxID=349273 RepID=UPI0025E732BA|nr:SDR family NAD(P)-dependent oxidoreductase [uncultured Phenylobacterium sp.]